MGAGVGATVVPYSGRSINTQAPTVMPFDRRYTSQQSAPTSQAAYDRQFSTQGRGGGQGSLANQLQSLFGPGMAAGNAAADRNIGQLNQQIGMLQAGQQTQSGYINQDQGYGNERIGLNREGLGIQQGANNRASVFIPQQHALTMADLTAQKQKANYGANMQRRDLTSGATVAGSLQSAGARQGFTDIAKQLGFTKAEIHRARQGENINFNERMAQNNDNRQQLNLAGRGLDLDARELSTRTQRALDQLGLSTSISIMDVTRAINDTNAGRYNNLAPYLGAIYQAGGIRPTGGG